MSGEHNLWVAARRHLGAYGHFVRLECPIASGIPDVHFTLPRASGFIELKCVAAWPKRARSPVCIASLKPAQVVWLEQEAAAGGKAFMLAQIGGSWLLLDVATVRSVFAGKETRESLCRRALVHGDGRRFPTKEILHALM
jgi:hypothetical protein